MWDIVLQNLPTIVILTLAFIICGAELIKALKVWREANQQQINAEVQKQQKDTELLQEIKSLHDKMDQVNETLGKVDVRLSDVEGHVFDLTVSDMHDIKAWIVDQYHKFYEGQGWIDAFSAETLDRRFSDYKKEGGNSYIETLMERLHTLSMDPAHSIHRDRNNNGNNANSNANVPNNQRRDDSR